MPISYEGLQIAIAVGGFVMTLGSTIVAVTLGINRIGANAEKQIVEAVERARAEFRAELVTIERRWRLEQEVQDRNFGETGKALREANTLLEKKVYQVEIWARDTLVLPLADVIKDVRHTKRNFELHQQIYKDLSDEVIRLQKDVERLSKAINGKH